VSLLELCQLVVVLSVLFAGVFVKFDEVLYEGLVSNVVEIFLIVLYYVLGDFVHIFEDVLKQDEHYIDAIDGGYNLFYYVRVFIYYENFPNSYIFMLLKEF
jgi:hypothetical protein